MIELNKYKLALKKKFKGDHFTVFKICVLNNFEYLTIVLEEDLKKGVITPMVGLGPIIYDPKQNEIICISEVDFSKLNLDITIEKLYELEDKDKLKVLWTARS